MIKRGSGNYKLCIAQANAFFDAACFCQHKNSEMVSEYLFAFSTNIAFSGELYLKALSIRFSADKMFYKEHDLKILFNDLPDLNKKVIKEAYNTEFHIHPFEEMLEWHKDIFNEWRYGFAATKDLKIQSTDFGTFVRSLKNICNGIC